MEADEEFGSWPRIGTSRFRGRVTKPEKLIGTRSADRIRACGHACRVEQAAHMSAPRPSGISTRIPLRGGGRSLIAARSSSLKIAPPGHGSLRGQPELPQHLVRSGGTGIARSTTGLRVITCPRPRPRNCLHPRPGGRYTCPEFLPMTWVHLWLRGPAEWLS